MTGVLGFSGQKNAYRDWAKFAERRIIVTGLQPASQTFTGHMQYAPQKNGDAPEKVRLRLVLRFQEGKVILYLLSPY